MQVFNRFEDLQESYAGCVIALGTFDGIHLGHVDIIRTAKECAMQAGKKLVVFSFSNHPLDQLAPEKSPPRLCSEEKKKLLLDSLAVDVLFNMHFDSKLATVSSDQFVMDLKKFFSPSCVVVGDNYSYGYLGAGSAETLLADGNKYGFAVVVRSLVEIDGLVVSSTNIRNKVLAGDILTANKLLGRCYSISGEVVAGDARGRKLGFPTANISLAPANQTIAADGVYAVLVKIGEDTFKAVVSIGKNPTFELASRRVEVHILDFAGVLYGKTIEIAFVDKIRAMKKFADEQELVASISADIEKAKTILSLSGNLCS